MTSTTSRTLYVSLGLLVAVQLVTSVSAVVLHARMAPAIERIVEDNVQSVEAVEEMALALASGASNAKPRFESALARASRNVTEEEERRPLATLERHMDASLAGDPVARAEVIAALSALGRINREALNREDREAKRLGIAGAWASVFLSLLGVLTGILVLRRINANLLSPLTELSQVSVAAMRGDAHRRCHSPTAVAEIARAMTALNELLDVRDRAQVTARPSSGVDREALLALLDDEPEVRLIVDSAGDVVAASSSALELLAGPDRAGIGDELRAARLNDTSSERVTTRSLGDRFELCVVQPSDS